MKDLAVLIPVYNDGDALRTTLKSIEEKDNSFTVVIVDDGSHEPIHLNTEDYPFAIHLIRLPENRGIVEALNAGIDYISTRDFTLIARLDAADLNCPNRFAQQYDFLLHNEGISMVGSNVVFRSEETNKALFTTDLPLSPNSVRRWIVFQNCFIHPSVVIRVSALREAGKYDETFRHIEDYELFTRIVSKFEAANLEEPLVHCYIRAKGISLRNQKSQLLSGLKLKMQNPRPFDALWYAFLFKRCSYFLLPHTLRLSLKKKFGFVRSGGSGIPSETSPPST